MGLARLAVLHGVATAYEPSPGRTVDVPEDTVVAVLAALGVDATTPRAVRAALDLQAHRAAGRLLPDTVVLHTPVASAAPPPTAPPAAGGAPATGTAAPGAPLRGLPAAGAPVPSLPDGTVLHIETEHGEQLPWDTAALLRAMTPPAGTPGPGPARRIPLGTHLLHATAPDGRTGRATLIVAPDRVPQPAARTYGFLVQLYSLLSARSWGMGDLGDLADLAAWSGRSLGTGFLQLNPLHAAVRGRDTDPTDPSPYRPSSRRFPDPVHLRVTQVPEYADLTGPARDRAARLVGQAAALRDGVLHGDALIDRDAVWRLKREALELVRAVEPGPGRRAAHADFLAAQGQALEDHATWCALAEIHGPDWHDWPAGLRDPRSAHTARARAELRDRVDFHRWLAWLTDVQLADAQRAARDAGMGIGLVHDLAVGVHPGGADVWARQDAFATGMSVGAPPDAFNSRGQDWGLPPWRPDVLAAAGHAPYRELLRGLLRHAGALRIDHVMGLFRLWWVPEGRPPTQGTYVRYDAEAMLGVLALEAHRAGAVVLGEDLGTVEPGVRDALAGRGVLGTSVLWFERDYAGAADGAARPLEPEAWRAGCLATATTHDLPSTAARLTGEHVELRHGLGLLSRPLAEERAADAAEVAEWLSLLRRLGLLPEGGEGPEGVEDEEEAIRAVHRFLARTPASMVGVWLPDGVGDRRPQNLPGTWDQYPNWRLPVAGADGRPVTLEQLAASPRLRALMTELAERMPGPAVASPTAPSPVVPSPAAAGLPPSEPAGPVGRSGPGSHGPARPGPGPYGRDDAPEPRRPTGGDDRPLRPAP
ncbi:4-alpha-glucanotransferase [Streptomyces sp. NPDC001922]|uniref:4-alpha-glucanotransferase n=1 Tax=Streptomyces sp. NPDC001922 TaxID=3364624 RepID=UPI0036D0745D